MLKKQKIISHSLRAVAYRNIRRPEVDKLFNIKYMKRKDRDIRRFDYLARKLWREIIKESNKL